MEPLSEELKGLLETSGPEAIDSVKEILRRPDLIKQTLDMLPQFIEEVGRKAGPEGVTWVLSRRFEIFPQPNRSQGQWETWWTSYFEVLKDVPLCKLEAGMIDYMAGAKAEFMPKPGQLFQAAMISQPIELQRWYVAKQVERGVKAGDNVRIRPEERSILEPPTEEGRARVRTMLDEFKSKMVEHNPPPKPRELPNTAGPVDQGGLTSQMRAKLADEYGTRHPFGSPIGDEDVDKPRNGFEA